MAQIKGIKPISGLKLTTGLQVIGMLIGVLGFVGGIVLILAGIFGNGLVLLIAAVLTGMLFQAIAAALELLVSIEANTRATRDYLERLSQRA